MKPEYVVGTFVATLLFAVASIVIPALPWPQAVKDMSGSEWASWVQAFGSIFAIIGTGWGVLYQQRTQREHSLAMAERQELEAAARACMRLEMLAQSLLAAVDRVNVAFENPAAVRHWHALGWVGTVGLNAFESRFATFDVEHLPQAAVYLPDLIASNIAIFINAITVIGQRKPPLMDEQLKIPLDDIHTALNHCRHAHFVASRERKRLDELLGR